MDFENIFDQSLDSKQDFIRFPDPSITAECRFIHLFGPAFGLCVKKKIFAQILDKRQNFNCGFS